MKRCPGCQQEKDATEFYANRAAASGLSARCKDCTKAYRRRLRAIDPDYGMAKRRCEVIARSVALELLRASKHQQAVAQRQQVAEFKALRQAERTDEVAFIKRIRAAQIEDPYKRCPACLERKHISDYTSSGGRIRTYCPTCHRERKRQERHKYKDQMRAAKKRSDKRHPERNRAHKQRRRARELGLAAAWQDRDRHRALDYFHGACAYCQKGPSYLDNNRVLHMDHYIPLASPDCPGTISANIVPACQSCNLHKADKDPRVWLAERFGARKAAEIEARILVYFTSLDQP